ncbi:thymidylate kinase-domain-containing protein [Sphaerosporella brunnea]|uniref:Thymidylate kinase n=1 Tax=Sphaerosporella brunnea TaxID=1250544 RepID=A0A5J5F339_9PEZI|nr:thymidylate kinase-domain-containing protein [Sphaerosporella brunnea]
MATPQPPTRGALIVIEGLDRAGKSTQCSRLQQRIPNSRIIKFPDRSTPIGQLINNYLTSASSPPLTDQAIHLLFSANRWELLPSLLAALSAGETLILDRYIYSGISFSVAKGALSYEYCRSPDVGLPLPDGIIFLDLPPDVAAERAGFGGERYEKREMQEKVREVFKTVREREQGEWTVVDASASVEEVTERVWAATEKALRWARENELREIE